MLIPVWGEAEQVARNDPEGAGGAGAQAEKQQTGLMEGDTCRAARSHRGGASVPRRSDPV